MLRDKIQHEMQEALRAGDNLRVSVLRLLMNAIHNKEIEKYAQIQRTSGAKSKAELEEESFLQDDEIRHVIMQEAKKRKDAIALYQKGGRPERAEQETKELALLEQYLPSQAKEEEIKTEVMAIIQELGAQGPQDFGKVMGAVMAKLRERAEGGIVSKIVREMLSK